MASFDTPLDTLKVLADQLKNQQGNDSLLGLLQKARGEIEGIVTSEKKTRLRLEKKELELDSRLSSLGEHEATAEENARKYEETMEDLHVAEMRADTYEGQVEALQGQVEKLRGDLKTARKKAKKSGGGDDDAQISQLRQELEAWKERARALENETSNADEEKAGWRGRQREYQRQLEELRSTISHMESLHERQQRYAKGRERTLELEISQLKDEVQDYQRTTNTGQAVKQNRELLSLIRSLCAQRSAAISARAADSILLSAQLTYLEDRSRTLEAKVQFQAGEIHELENASEDTALLVNDLYQELAEEVGRSTNYRIQYNLERKAHDITREGVSDSITYIRDSYEEQLELLRDGHAAEVEALEETLEVQAAEWEEVKQVDDEEIADLTLALSFSVTDQQAFLLGRAAAMKQYDEEGNPLPQQQQQQQQQQKIGQEGYVNDSAKDEAIRELEETVEELEEELAVQIGENFHMGIEHKKTQWLLDTCRAELKDSVTHMERYYTSRYRPVLDKAKFDRQIAAETAERLVLEAEQDKQWYQETVARLELDVESLEEKLAWYTEDRQLLMEENAALEKEMSDVRYIGYLNSVIGGYDRTIIKEKLPDVLQKLDRVREQLFQTQTQHSVMVEGFMTEMHRALHDVHMQSEALMEKKLADEKRSWERAQMAAQEEASEVQGVLEGTIVTLKKALGEQVELVRRLSDESGVLSEQVGGHNSEVERLEKELGELAFLAESSHTDKLALEMEVADRKNQVEELQAEVQSLQNVERTLRAQMAQANQDVEDITFLIEVQQQKIATLEAEVATVSASQMEAEALVDVAKMEAQRLRLDNQGIVSQSEEATTGLQLMKKQLADARKLVQQGRKELQDAQGLLRRALGVRGEVTEKMVERKEAQRHEEAVQRVVQKLSAITDDTSLELALHDHVQHLEQNVISRDSTIELLEGELEEQRAKMDRLYGEVSRMSSVQARLRMALQDAIDKANAAEKARQIANAHRGLVQNNMDAVIRQGFVVNNEQYDSNIGRF